MRRLTAFERRIWLRNSLKINRERNKRQRGREGIYLDLHILFPTSLNSVREG
jgi:hypothetical protein